MIANLFAGLPTTAQADEQFSALLNRPGLRIERIVSTGQASPPDFWYDQPEGEWVILLQGSATLRFADTPEPVALTPGDFIDIPPHRRHRVESTNAGQTTVWLVVHYATTHVGDCNSPGLAFLTARPTSENASPP